LAEPLPLTTTRGLPAGESSEPGLSGSRKMETEGRDGTKGEIREERRREQVKIDSSCPLRS